MKSLSNYTSLLATLLLIVCCSKDDPKEQTPKTFDLEMIGMNATGPIPATVTLPEIPAKIQDLSITGIHDPNTQKRTSYRGDASENGKVRVGFKRMDDTKSVIITKDGSSSGMWYKINNAEYALLIDEKSDTIKFNITTKSLIASFSNQTHAESVLKPALEGGFINLTNVRSETSIR
jgi:hypothetical protein